MERLAKTFIHATRKLKEDVKTSVTKKERRLYVLVNHQRTTT
jgi:hypothetical protein